MASCTAQGQPGAVGMVEQESAFDQARGFGTQTRDVFYDGKQVQELIKLRRELNAYIKSLNVGRPTEASLGADDSISADSDAPPVTTAAT